MRHSRLHSGRSKVAMGRNELRQIRFQTGVLPRIPLPPVGIHRLFAKSNRRAAGTRPVLSTFYVCIARCVCWDQARTCSSPPAKATVGRNTTIQCAKLSCREFVAAGACCARGPCPDQIPSPRRNISTILSGFVKVRRAGARWAERESQARSPERCVRRAPAKAEDLSY
jgi:hypothetical protein